jgi:hypothetical protein
MPGPFFAAFRREAPPTCRGLIKRFDNLLVHVAERGQEYVEHALEELGEPVYRQTESTSISGPIAGGECCDSGLERSGNLPELGFNPGAVMEQLAAQK